MLAHTFNNYKTSLMKKIILLLLPIIFFGVVAFQSKIEKVITGSIADEKGNPISFAAIRVKDARVGTSADANGVYKITLPQNATAIVFAAVGFVSVEEQINNRTVINVTLKKSSQTLSEVVIVSAFGQKKQSRQVGYATNAIGNTQAVIVRGSSSISPAPVLESDDEGNNTEAYSNIVENGFKNVTDNPVSTFSIDVDAASYSNVRRFLSQGQLPPSGAVRTEEMINYFKYQYPQPTNSDPFSFNTEMSNCPWNKEHKLLLVGLQGKTMPTENLPASNLVFNRCFGFYER